MKITRISVFHKNFDLSHPYYLSGGRLKFERIDSTFVKIETDESVHGWGEACPWGVTYLPAHGKGIRAGLEEIAPGLIGKDPRQLDRINRLMDVTLPGHPYVKSAVDIACWDILGKVTNMPVCDLLGGREPAPVPIASSISTGTPEEMLDNIQSYRDKGYRVHSAKVGADVDLDISRIRHMSTHQLDGEKIFYDVNRAWLPREAIAVMNAVDVTNSWFEQPCETLDEIAMVRARTTQPICVDEGLHTFTDLTRIHRDQIAELVNIKINRVGGLTKARRLRDYCLGAGISMLIMDTGGSVLADTSTAHFAQSIPAVSCLGTWSCQEMLTVDPAPGQGARNIDGCFTAPDQPGIGVEPDIKILGDAVAIYE